MNVLSAARPDFPVRAADIWEEFMYFIGIDLGTSAVKLLLMDEEGTVWNTVTEEYPICFPKPGW